MQTEPAALQSSHRLIQDEAFDRFMRERNRLGQGVLPIERLYEYFVAWMSIHYPAGAHIPRILFERLYRRYLERRS